MAQDAFGGKLEIKYSENVIFFEIEVADDFNPEAISGSERKELEVYNDNFIQTQLSGLLLSKIGVCECRVFEVNQKHQRRAALSGNPQTYVPRPDQEDVDTYRFGVIVLTDHGKITGVSCIIRQCKKCMKIDYWGDVAVFSRMVAEVTTNFYNNMPTPEEVAAQDAADAEALNKEGQPGEPSAQPEDVPAQDGMPSDSDGESFADTGSPDLHIVK